MKRKLLAALLTGVMAASLFTACGSTTAKSTPAEPADSESTAVEGSEAAEEAEGSVIDMTGDPYEVAIQVVVLPGVEYDFEEDMEAAIDEISVSAINCTVDIQFVPISELATTTSMGVAGGEKLDIIHVGTVQPLSSLVGSEILYDMNQDDLLATHGKDIVELMGEDLIESGNVGGQQLAIPAKIFNCLAKGFSYNKTVTDSLGITVPETGTIDDLEAMLYAVKDSGYDIMPFYIGSGTSLQLYWLQNYDGFGTECSYGCIMDAETDLTVENMYASEEFKDFCLRMYRWRQDGILCKDATDTNTHQDYFANQMVVSGIGDISPELNATYKAQHEQDGWEYAVCQMYSGKVTNATVTEYMWGINVNSERPDKAMDFLNLLYSNADVANILKYGLEGSGYTFADGSDKIIESTGNYNPSFYNGGNTAEMYIASPADESYIQEWEDMLAESTVSPIIGYTFDDTDFQTESSVISTVITKYLPALQNGSYSSEEETLEVIDSFVADLEAAGINDVIAANQAQLDEFMASK